MLGRATIFEGRWSPARGLGQLVLLLIFYIAGASTQAQPERPELLNSERIATRFGNYGIEVLESSLQTRISNLFSTHSGDRLTRTFALVHYPSDMAPDLDAPHAEILAGGSIGAVLKAAGWDVQKRHLYFGDVAASAELAELMHVAPGTTLAEHAYVLDAAKNGRVLPYATLIEIHHPDYLRAADLPRIYGPASSTGRKAELAAVLAVAAERLGRD